MKPAPSRETTSHTLGRRWITLLATPVDAASLAAFRICFGLVMCWHVAEYLRPRQGTNLARFLYVSSPWNFPYPGWEWVRPWPEPLLTWHFLLVGLAAFCSFIFLPATHAPRPAGPSVLIGT